MRNIKLFDNYVEKKDYNLKYDIYPSLTLGIIFANTYVAPTGLHKCKQKLGQAFGRLVLLSLIPYGTSTCSLSTS